MKAQEVQNTFFSCREPKTETYGNDNFQRSLRPIYMHGTLIVIVLWDVLIKVWSLV